MATMLPPESTSTTSAKAEPTPVWLTAPTMMPAVAVATPMPIMLRAPATRPSRQIGEALLGRRDGIAP